MLGYALVMLLFANSVADLPPGAVMRLGDARWRAGGEIRHLCFSTDGESLSAWVAGREGQLRPIAWNKATGFLVAPPTDRMPPDLPDGTTPAVRLKDDRVLTAGPGNAGRVWDATTARQLARLTGHTSSVTAVAISADGKLLATGSADGLVRVWDAETFRPLSEPRGHLAPITHAELSPDGQRLVTWARDESVRVWDMTTGKELRAFSGACRLGQAPHDCGQQPTFTPDGLAVVFSTKDRLLARDVLTGLEVLLPGDLAKHHPGFAVFAPDSKAVLTWDGVSERLAVWDWPSGRKRFDQEWSLVRSPGFSPDGSVFFNTENLAQRYDTSTGKRLSSLWDWTADGYDAKALLSLRPNPRHMIAELGSPPELIEAGSGKSVPNALIRVPAEWSWSGMDVTLSSDHRQMAIRAAQTPDEVSVCEARSGQLRRTFTGHCGSVRVLGFTPDGTKLLTAGDDHTVLVWDMRLQAVPLPEAVRRETNAAKLWAAMCVGKADEAFLAMARLAAEPDAALQTARMRLRAAEKSDGETEAVKLADSRAIELLESLGTPEARAFLKELAAGHADAFRTQEAKRVLERLGKLGYNGGK
jgi:WD40 repeat protein